jgi:phosphoribosylformimino-5-aminoimidazole carboxamide ribotide isomerase
MFVIPSLQLAADTSRSYVDGVAAMMRGWEEAGFSRIQLVLPPGNDPRGDQRLLEEVLRDPQCSTQVAGRFEAGEDVDAALSAGAELVVLGSRALDDFDWLASIADRFPDQLLVATPARERRSRVRGAVRTLPVDLRDLAGDLSALPLAAIVVEFAVDVVIDHAELALLEDVVEELEFPVQVTGGAPDLRTLRDLEFRGVGAAILAAEHLSAAFDEQTLAHSFTD